MIFYRRFLYSIPWCLFLLSSLLTAIAIPSAKAGTIFEANDGTGTSVSWQGSQFDITGGTTAGNNLFHSFQEFGLDAGHIANFLSAPSIHNILGRVVGGNPSLINGLIQVTGGNSNLFLMNPAGMVFGADVSLNVPGDFTATTATGIGFGNDQWFNAFGNNNYAALTGIPFQFAFDLSEPAPILNQGTLQGGGDLMLIGGAIANAGTAIAPNGTITLAAVPGSSLIRLKQAGSLLSLEVELPRNSAGEIFPFTALELPGLLTGDVAIAGEVRSQNVNLAAVNPIHPQDPTLIRTGDGTQHAPTVMRFGNIGESWDYTFIDERADNPHELLYGGEAGTVSRLVLRGEDGIGKITESLNFAENPVDTLTIVAEGNAGELWLGKDFITSQNVAQYRTQMENWGQSLASTADILLYSCFTALGAVGESFVNQIADATGADVAASLDATGSANYGGNWTLEYSTGNIAADIPFIEETLNNWQGRLATRTVTDLSNAGAFTLRDALTGSGGGFGSAPTAGDEIRFSLSGTISLTGQITWGTDNLTIDGSGQSIILDGGGGDRVFEIFADNATIKNLTIQNGSTAVDGGGIYHVGLGTLTVENSTISGNLSNNKGGGIFAYQLSLTNSTVSGNSSYEKGGGIYAYAGASISDSTISYNSSDNKGGGIYTYSSVTISNSTISKNSSSDDGGGVATYNITISDSTISENSSNKEGGGIYADSSAIVNNSTISGNSSNKEGGGLDATYITLDNSTISGNSSNEEGGGIDAYLIGISNSTISGNFSNFYGGGLDASYASITNNSVISGNVSNSDGGGVSALNLTIADSTISGNSSTLKGGGILAYFNATIGNSTISGNSSSDRGGGISADNVTISNSTISGNSSNNKGGGIYAYSSATITDSTISGNSSYEDGGGIDAYNLTMNNSTIAGNSSHSYGGGIDAFHATIDNSTIAGNSSKDQGGGIDTLTADITNSTISGNVANTSGGGIYARYGTIRNSTIAFNIADADNNGIGDGGGIFRDGTTNTLTVENTIVAQNSDRGGQASDLGGTFDTIQYSLIENPTGATLLNENNNIKGVNPLLLPLANNGGSTQTHALASNSPAIDAGNNGLVTTSTDQRGSNRIVEGTVDIGAYEFVPVVVTPVVTPTTTTPTPTPTPTPTTPINFPNAVDLVSIPSSPIALVNPLGGGGNSISPARAFSLFDAQFSNSFQQYFASGSSSGVTSGGTSGGNASNTGTASGLTSSGASSGFGSTGNAIASNNTGSTFTGSAIGNNGSGSGSSAIAGNSSGSTSTGNAIAGNSSGSTSTGSAIAGNRSGSGGSAIASNSVASTSTSGGSSSASDASNGMTSPSIGGTDTSESGTSESNSSNSGNSTSFNNASNKGSGGSSSSSASDGDSSEEELNLARAQASLDEVYRATGVKPALLYAIFIPPLGNSTGNPEESGNDRLFLMLVPPGGDPVIRPVPVNRELALRMSDRFRNATINTRRPTSFLRPSQKLYEWLIAPVAEDLENFQIQHLTFLLDSGLRSLPVAALHDGEQFLVERYSLSLMPSMALTDLSYADVRGMSLLAMGAETFDDQNPLPAAGAEVDLLTNQLWQGDSYLNDDFTVEKLLEARNANSFRMIHLATHGKFESGSPDDSFIYLGAGKLPLSQIRNLGLHDPPVELLVLSACETALGDVQAELGFAGLAVMAGVKSALGSLWQVSDSGTLGLMTTFYEQLKEAPIKAEALRRSQLSMIRGETRLGEGEIVTTRGSIALEQTLTGGGDLSHPYFWSPFTLIGTPW